MINWKINGTDSKSFAFRKGKIVALIESLSSPSTLREGKTQQN